MSEYSFFCANCGNLSDEEPFDTGDGEVCQSCEEQYTDCNSCLTTYLLAELIQVGEPSRSHTGYMCVACWEDENKVCYICNEAKPNTRIAEYNGENEGESICPECLAAQNQK